MPPVLSSRATAHAWHRLSARELLTGIKTSFTRDLRIGFFDYAQLTEPVNETTQNSLKPRTRECVALYSSGYTKGSVIFMSLDTGTEAAREKLHILPMPDVVTSHLTPQLRKTRKHLEPIQLSYITASSSQTTYHFTTLKTRNFLPYLLRHRHLQQITPSILLRNMILQIMVSVNQRFQLTC